MALYTVTSTQLNLRSTPGVASNNLVTTLPNGQQVENNSYFPNALKAGESWDTGQMLPESTTAQSRSARGDRVA